MSMENIGSFFEKAKADPALRQQIADLAPLEAKPRIEALVRLSHEAGTPFTVEDLAIHTARHAPLSDAELDTVAGGTPIFGFSTPSLHGASEIAYAEMWAQDAAAMIEYHGRSR